MISRSEELLLIGRCVAFDDRHAFGQLVDAYAPSLRAYLFTLCRGDEALTADLAQESFLKAYRSLRQFKGMAGFRTWLFRIAYNEYIDWTRRHHEERIELQSGTERAAVEATPASDPHRLTEMRHDLTLALAQLSEKEWSLVTLFYYEDMPVKKIAKVMSMPEGTIKVYLSRAKKKMAAFLNSDRPDRS